jgi:hypothetical protein
MRPEEITLAIFEKFTPAELATTASEMAQAVAEMETAEAEKKASDAAFKERINAHAAKVSELAQKYNKGGETAQIGCKIRYDIPTVGQKSYIRMDTEKTVEVHDMSDQEKQETFQFPLTASAEAASEEKASDTEPTAPEPADEPVLTAPAVKEITFADIQAIAKHIAHLQAAKREAAIADLQDKIATRLLVCGKVIGPDGRLEDVQTPEIAAKIAAAWLLLALEELAKPPATEEVTRMCPYPGCILFAEHDGDHDFPPADAAPADMLEPQPQKEKKTRTRKSRPHAEPGAPA